MIPSLCPPSEPEAVAALENNLSDFWRLLGRSPLVELHEKPDCIRFFTGVPFALLNGVARVRFGEEDLDSRVDEALAGFRSRQLPMLWWMDSRTRPSRLGEALESRGLHRSEIPGMAMDLRKLPEEDALPPGVTVERVGETTLEAFMRAAAEGYGFPEFVIEPVTRIFRDIGLSGEAPIRHTLARLDGEPAATVSVLLSSGVAGVYNVATVPAARRRGIAAALVREALRDARCEGYRTAVLEASQMGYNIYRRTGFEDVCKVAHYMDGA